MLHSTGVPLIELRQRRTSPEPVGMTSVTDRLLGPGIRAPVDESDGDADGASSRRARGRRGSSGNLAELTVGTTSSTAAAGRSWVGEAICRITHAALFTTLLAAMCIGLQYTDGLPKQFDYGVLRFDAAPSALPLTLQPYDADFPAGYNVFLDGHSHTTLSDGSMTPEQLVDWHVMNGFNAAFVTDHNTVDGGLRAAEYVARTPALAGRFVVIPGMEYTCCRIHMNLLGINATVPLCGSGPTEGSNVCPGPTDDQLRQVIAAVHSSGGWVVVNHIPWSNTTERQLPDGGYQPRLPNHPSREQLLDWGVDAFEVVNTATLDLPTLQWAKSRGVRVITGSDVHEPSPAYSWTVLRTDEPPTAASIWRELVAGRSSFLFDPTGTRMPAWSTPQSPALSWQLLAPLLAIAQFFNLYYKLDSGMYSFQGTFCHVRQIALYWPAAAAFVLYFLAFLAAFSGLARGLAKGGPKLRAWANARWSSWR